MTPDETVLRTSPLARLVLRAPLVLSKHLWVWPLLGALILSVVGLWVRSQVEGTTRTELAERLQTLLNADIAALRLWSAEQEADAVSFADEARIQAAIAELTDLARESNISAATLTNSAPAKALQRYLQPLLEAQNYVDYVVVGPDRRILASPVAELVNRVAPAGYNHFVERALQGKTAISLPFAHEARPALPVQDPTMFVGAPVKSTNGSVIAVLGLRMRPDDEFSRIFSVARMGETGEAYAFDSTGMMLTTSRFPTALRALGLLPANPEATTILNLRLLDPGFDSKHGPKPPQAGQQPRLTRMAAAATAGQNGFDVQGYRNYRGLKVIGAWVWLPKFQMGIATEVTSAEAFGTLYVLRQAFWALFLLLVLSGLAIFGFTVLVERLEASVRKSALAARRLGNYVLVQEIGRGANGMVYRARHSLMRRPVAIKLLSPDQTNEATAAGFEHEVQMTSQLTHPNTVAIYDYGRTPEGLFYYAMEYLSGIDLDQLVRRYGPQPEGRVIQILRQICGSLAEAHKIGLIHRDIKPANIVLTRRGGACDVVKVLDFGLVKAVRPGPTEGAAEKTIVGTPHFMSPEAAAAPESVEARSDLYSVGAVGYWLLTGRTLFDTGDVAALLHQHVNAEPPRPSVDHVEEPPPPRPSERGEGVLHPRDHAAAMVLLPCRLV